VDSIVYDKKKIIPSCALLEGEYGVNGLFVGVPTKIGRSGIEEIIEVEMTEAEKEGFQRSVSAVQKTVDEVNQMG
jgi:malate dehydrogenase